MLLWTQKYRYFFGIMILLILDVYPKVRLLDNRAILFLISWGTTILFAKSGFTNVNFHQKCPCLFVIAFLIGVRWYLIEVFICISLVTLSILSFALCMSLLKCLFRFFTHFNLVIYYYCYWVVWIPFIFWILTSY